MTDIAAYLIQLEQSLLTPEVRSSRTKLDDLIHDDFNEIGTSGRSFGKDDVLNRLPVEADPATYTAENMEARELAPTLWQVTFFTSTPKPALRSSLWILYDNRWQIIFHQGTPRP